MELSDGTTKKFNNRIRFLACTATCFCLLSGCGAVDTIRPDINNTGRMIVDPSVLSEVYAEIAEDTGVGDGMSDTGVDVTDEDIPSPSEGSSSSGDTSSGGSSGGSSSAGTVTPSGSYTRLSSDASGRIYTLTLTDTVQISDYNQYLEKEIVEPIAKILAKYDASSSGGTCPIYFRVLSLGKDLGGFSIDPSDDLPTSSGVENFLKDGVF